MQELEDGHDAAATFRLRVHAQGHAAAGARGHSPGWRQAGDRLHLLQPHLGSPLLASLGPGPALLLHEEAHELLLQGLHVLQAGCLEVDKTDAGPSFLLVGPSWLWLSPLHNPLLPNANLVDFRPRARHRRKRLTECGTSSHECTRSEP